MKTLPPSPPVDPPSDKWGWHRQTLLEMRERLIHEHDEHTHDLRVPLDSSGEDPTDLASRRTERDTLLAELRSEETELAEIEAALERIRDGSYGRCELTHRPISAPRLRAIPWTRLSHRAAFNLRREQPQSAPRSTKRRRTRPIATTEAQSPPSQR